LRAELFGNSAGAVVRNDEERERFSGFWMLQSLWQRTRKRRGRLPPSFQLPQS